jgi:hypothetical protein
LIKSELSESNDESRTLFFATFGLLRQLETSIVDSEQTRKLWSSATVKRDRHARARCDFLRSRLKACALACLSFLAVRPAVEHQGDVGFVHDPSVIKSKHTYVLFSTGNGIPIRTSGDLVRWQQVGEVFAENVPALRLPLRQVPRVREKKKPFLQVPDFAELDHRLTRSDRSRLLGTVADHLRDADIPMSAVRPDAPAAVLHDDRKGGIEASRCRT